MEHLVDIVSTNGFKVVAVRHQTNVPNLTIPIKKLAKRNVLTVSSAFVFRFRLGLPPPDTLPTAIVRVVCWMIRTVLAKRRTRSKTRDVAEGCFVHMGLCVHKLVKRTLQRN